MKSKYILTAFDSSESLPEVKYFRSPDLYGLITFLGRSPELDTWYIVRYDTKGIFRKKEVGKLVARSVGLEGV